jgi:hypothetical protein
MAEKEETTTILLLGGYGNTGRILAKLLSQDATVDRLIVAGRNIERAHELIREIQSEHAESCDLLALCVDAAEPVYRLASTMRLHKVTLLMVACSSTKYSINLARAALEAKVDVMDVQYSRHKTEALQQMKDEIQEAGCCFITECGFHPGLPAAMIRYMCNKSSQGLDSAIVSSLIRLDWKNLPATPSPESTQDFAAEFADFSTLTYKDGKWREEGFMKPKYVDFGAPFGTRPVIPMYLEELHNLPSLYPSLQETGFYVGSLNFMVDWVIAPIVMLAMKLWPHSQLVRRGTGRLLHWGLVTFSKPPYGTVLRVEAREGVHQKVMSISHQDAYALTAIPMAAAFRQYQDGSVRAPGLWLQGAVVEPCRLIKDMEEMGVSVLEGD